tara:strand:+ start:15009 stop:15203 length:195 start_codon:yes stop_codon:yes gene_type:complete
MGHLQDIEETYWEHFRHAFEIASVLVLSSIAQLVHAVWPNFKPPFGSDVDSLIDFLDSKRSDHR